MPLPYRLFLLVAQLDGSDSAALWALCIDVHQEERRLGVGGLMGLGQRADIPMQQSQDYPTAAQVDLVAPELPEPDAK